MSDVAGKDRNQNAERMGYGFRMPGESKAREHHLSEQKANRNGLNDSGQIDGSEPKYLLMKRVFCVAENKQTIHHECCHHTQQIGQHDRRHVRHPYAQYDTREKIYAGRKTSHEQKFHWPSKQPLFPCLLRGGPQCVVLHFSGREQFAQVFYPL